jgi:hypothetical protein
MVWHSRRNISAWFPYNRTTWLTYSDSPWTDCRDILTETESRDLRPLQEQAANTKLMAEYSAVKLQSTVFWDVTLCSLVEVCRHFGGTYCLHLHVRRLSSIQQARKWHESKKMEAVIFSETSVARTSSLTKVKLFEIFLAPNFTKKWSLFPIVRQSSQIKTFTAYFLWVTTNVYTSASQTFGKCGPVCYHNIPIKSKQLRLSSENRRKIIVQGVINHFFLFNNLK